MIQRLACWGGATYTSASVPIQVRLYPFLGNIGNMRSLFHVGKESSADNNNAMSIAPPSLLKSLVPLLPLLIFKLLREWLRKSAMVVPRMQSAKAILSYECHLLLEVLVLKYWNFRATVIDRMQIIDWAILRSRTAGVTLTDEERISSAPLGDKSILIEWMMQALWWIYRRHFLSCWIWLTLGNEYLWIDSICIIQKDSKIGKTKLGSYWKGLWPPPTAPIAASSRQLQRWLPWATQILIFQVQDFLGRDGFMSAMHRLPLATM